MKPIAVAVVRAGLVDSDVLAEFKRWKLPVQLVEEDQVLSNPRQIVDLIQNALEGEEQVRINETDLDLLVRYLDPRHRKEGTLIIKTEEGKSSFKVTFCVTTMGEYAIPWVSESISDLILREGSYLRFKNLEGENEKVTFMDVREVFFGDHKSFMVCVPGGTMP